MLHPPFRPAAAYDKRKYMWKLLYTRLLGYDVDFGVKNASDLIAAPGCAAGRGWFVLQGLLPPWRCSAADERGSLCMPQGCGGAGHVCVARLQPGSRSRTCCVLLAGIRRSKWATLPAVFSSMRCDPAGFAVGSAGGSFAQRQRQRQQQRQQQACSTWSCWVGAPTLCALSASRRTSSCGW